jgi:hypothetical protein
MCLSCAQLAAPDGSSGWFERFELGAWVVPRAAGIALDLLACLCKRRKLDGGVVTELSSVFLPALLPVYPASSPNVPCILLLACPTASQVPACCLHTSHAAGPLG